VPVGGDIFQYEALGPCSGGAGEDGLLEHSRFGCTVGASQVWVLVEPGEVGGQVALCGSDWVDSSCHKFPQTHERVWGEGGEVFIVRGCRGISGPLLEEHVPRAGSKGLVGLSNEFRGGNVCSGWWGGLQDKREACEASLQG